MSNIIEKITECIEVDGFKVNCIKNDLSITNYLKNQGKMWEIWLEKYIKESYIENTNMIDIGAHIGTTSLLMSKYLSNNCYIHAFEPIYNEILKYNIEQNNLKDKIIIHPIGLSNISEKLQGGYIDFTKEQNYGYSNLDELKKATETSELIIRTEPLDKININNVSFIKIDVEGSERKVLEGAIKTITNNKPAILIEIWCTSENSKEKYTNDKHLSEVKKQFSVFEYLFNLGYICFPVSVTSDDFLFIHHSKKELLNKVINIL